MRTKGLLKHRGLVKRLRGLKWPLATSLGALELLLSASENGWREEDRKLLWIAKHHLEQAAGAIQELLDETEGVRLKQQRQVVSR